MILVETSPGELIDKITVLEIKEDRITDPDKLRNVQYALGKLWAVRDAELPESKKLTRLTASLKAVNKDLWNSVESLHEFASNRGEDCGAGDYLVQIESLVMCHVQNDIRAMFKKKIDRLFDFAMTEEKSYALGIVP